METGGESPSHRGGEHCRWSRPSGGWEAELRRDGLGYGAVVSEQRGRHRLASPGCLEQNGRKESNKQPDLEDLKSCQPTHLVNRGEACSGHSSKGVAGRRALDLRPVTCRSHEPPGAPSRSQRLPAWATESEVT